MHSDEEPLTLSSLVVRVSPIQGGNRLTRAPWTDVPRPVERDRTAGQVTVQKNFPIYLLLSFRRKTILYDQEAMKISLSFAQSVRLVTCPALLLAACAATPTSQRSVGREELIKGEPQPKRWAAFVKSAAQGKVEQISDEPYPPPRLRTAAASEMFNGKFRPEVKTSYSTARNEPVTDVESLLKNLPTDAQMTSEHPELIAKDKNHQNHRPRIDREERNVTVKAWLYWVGRQVDNDYHLILGDTSQLTSQTVFMNTEISGLPQGGSNQQPFVGLRNALRSTLATHPNKNGAFVTPLPVSITGSLLWDGEHRNPNNSGPKKPVDIRPKKAWEIHPIHDFKA